MTTEPEPKPGGTSCCPPDVPTKPWGPNGHRPPCQQVIYSERSGGFAYRRRHVHCANQEATDRALDYLDSVGVVIDPEIPPGPVMPSDDDEEQLITLAPDVEVDLEFHVEEMRDRGIDVELNYVLFADVESGYGGGDDVGANPVYGSPVYGSPVYGSPVYGSPVYGSPVYGSPVYGSALLGGGQYAGTAYASPVYGSPVYGSPVYGSPVYGSTYKREGLRSNTARPVAPREPALGDPPADRVRSVVVLDTGIAGGSWCPDLLRHIDPECGDGAHDPPDDDGNDFFDPASGHGTFCAGIIEQLVPRQNLRVHRVLSSFGDGDVASITWTLNCIRRQLLATTDPLDPFTGPNTVINLSFGGYADRLMKFLARAIRRLQHIGAVVVASVGNDGTSRPAFPACLPGVVSVGALDCFGPAPYTNHGSWVRACAPGTDVVSAFYNDDPNNPLPSKLPVPQLPGSGDPSRYCGWARWTGTSFAAPVVTAALVRHMVLNDVTARQAVEAVIDAPDLFQVAGLGTVVNLVTPTPNEITPHP